MRIPNANVDIWQLAAADLLRGFASRINQTLFKQRDPLTRLELSTFFFYSQGDMLKPSVSYVFHFGEAFWKYHFVMRGPIQNWEHGILCRRNDRFILSRWEKIGNVSWSKNPMSLQLGRIFLQFWRTHAESSSKMELVMETFCLDWKLRADVPRFSLVPHEICVFGQKPSVFIFSKFSMRSQGAGRLRPQNGCWTWLVFYDKLLFFVRDLCAFELLRTRVFARDGFQSFRTIRANDLKPMFAYVNNMCNRSLIFYQRDLKPMFAHDNNMRKGSNIFY